MENLFHLRDTSSVTSDQWISLTHIFALLSFPVFTHLLTVGSYPGCPIGFGNLPQGECAQSQGAPGFHLHETFLFPFIYLGSVSFEGSYHCTWVWKKQQHKTFMEHHWSGFTPNLCKCKICWSIYLLFVSNITWTKTHYWLCVSHYSLTKKLTELYNLLSCLLDVYTTM